MINEVDKSAARRAITRNWPDLAADSTRYNAILDVFADFHRAFGSEKFELRYNLRPPKDRTETWIQQHMHGAISDDELHAFLKADAERPIDLEMLTTFHDAYMASLERYSEAMRHAVRQLSEQNANARRSHEHSIDRCVVAIDDKLPLWRENLETVFEFLEERRILSGQPLLKVGEFEGTSAHWLAQLILKRFSEAWKSCKEVARRSRRDPNYLYAATAVDLFFDTWFAKFPAPQAIGERLREEFVLARAALPSGVVAAPAPSASGDVAPLIDNESRELQLIGDVCRMVGDAGHIFRPLSNSDWGIDGEIEFKDERGNASGRRLYLQLKSGDSHLRLRSRDNVEVFQVKKERHLEYWVAQAYPVMLVIRSSSGLIRWMNVTAYLKNNPDVGRQLVFTGEEVSSQVIQRAASAAGSV